MLPSFTYVTVQVIHDVIAVVKYNKPRSGNSLHPQLLADMKSAMKWADELPNIKVIVQTGEGKFFCTGMHLVETEPISFAIGSDFHELNRILIESRKITIAAVNGPAAGYGVSSLALFDLVYSVPHAYFFTPFVKWGMAAEGASSFTFPRIMGHQKAATMFLAGNRITAQEAERLGLISSIVAANGFLESVIQIALTVAQSPAGALQATKELMRQSVRADMLAANDRECQIIHNERLPSGEPREAIARFKSDKRLERDSKSRL